MKGCTWASSCLWLWISCKQILRPHISFLTFHSYKSSSGKISILISYSRMWQYIFFQCKSLQDIAALKTLPRLSMLWLQLDTWTERWWYQLGIMKIFCHCCCCLSGEAGTYSNSTGTVADTLVHLSFHWAKEFSSFLFYQPMSSMSEVFPARHWPSQYHYNYSYLLVALCVGMSGCRTANEQAASLYPLSP